MIDKVLAGAMIGLSLGGAWLCAFFAFGIGASSRRAGLLYIAGRAIGLIAIGLAITVISIVLKRTVGPLMIGGKAMNVLFAVLIIIMGAYLLISSLGHWVPLPWKRRHPGDGTGPACGGKRDGSGPRGSGGCGQRNKANPPMTGDKGLSMGTFGLGLLRGLTPCVKILFLTPLLITSSIIESLFILIAFAVTSSIYSVIGFMSAELFRRFSRFQNEIRIAGSIMVLLIGMYYLVKHMVHL
ncbi:MAG: hypothetical protein QCI82_10245 [Candidatus Thermoplasmatota archaeon]|nr:hypothetical protein [Candidatus Thermoplasmatota archaeon]